MRKPQKVLPEKYYLDHFNEIISFNQQYCADLLFTEQKQFIQTYQALSHDSQCMLVRVVNRTGDFIQSDKMRYQEIDDCEKQLLLLTQAGLLRTLTSDDIAVWLELLTKPQLMDIAYQCQIYAIKKSASKEEVFQQVKAQCSVQDCLASDLAQSFLVKCFQSNLAYLLFLFFGNSNSKLDKFSMRDLEVLKTRDKNAQASARFDNKQQSYCCFYYSDKIAQIKRNDMDLAELAQRSEQINCHPQVPANSEYAQQLKDQYFYLLGKQLLTFLPELGMKYLQASTAAAQEKWLRERYRQGHKEQVKSQLEQIIEQSLDERLLLFAEDFYQRKYHQVKLSKLTATLRQDSYTLAIDEIHKEQVEKGVKQYYQNQGLKVYRTENRLFTSLFGLAFWQELFDPQLKAASSEFDRRPKVVKENTIYQRLEAQIEQRLSMFKQPKKAIAYLTKIATQYYGQPNGMFRWSSKIMQVISSFLQVADPQAVISHLRTMAKNYHGFNDGYPDLMIIQNKQLRFEEVKAPGDVIRANQFVTINALQLSGFEVQLCKVEWFVDPMQAYVVIDVETTGGKQPYHRVTEIGAVKVVNGEVVDSFSCLVNPQRHIPAFITKLTGISNDMVKDAPLFCEVADTLEKFLQNAVFVAHNVNFDYAFIKQEFARLERPFVMPKLCTVRESRKCFTGLKSYSLSNLCQHFNIPLTTHHRALCDAQATAELLKLIQRQQEQVE
ncbi:exonuclease domain-containing protein [Paraglaciecola aestuariivivens]